MWIVIKMGRYYSIFRNKIQKDSSREHIQDISRIFRDESKNLDSQRCNRLENERELKLISMTYECYYN